MRCHLPFSLLAYAATTILTPLVAASSTIRNPIGALAVVQNATIHTHNQRLTALHEFDLTFQIRDDLHVRFHLEPNHDLLAQDTTVTYLAPDGSISRQEPVDRLGHKVYRGSAWVQKLGNEADEWRHAGWARVSVFRDGPHPTFQGAFSVNRDTHHIQTSTGYMRTKHWDDPEIEVESDEYMVLWRDSDILPDSQAHHDLKSRNAAAAPVCQADDLVFNTRDDHPIYMSMKEKRYDERYGRMDFSHLFGKRQIDTTTGGNSAAGNLVASIGQTQGCPSTRRVALVGVATDCNYAADFDGNTQTARENVIDQMNTASAIYENTFNISLGLQNLTVMEANCPGTPVAATEWNQACSDSVDISDRLNMFSAWRGSQTDSNAFWTLLSTCNTGSAVGLAWLGQLCVGTAITVNGSVTGDGTVNTQGAETVTGANVVIRTPGADEWQVIAHEIGHTFGAVHDCTSSTCGSVTVAAQQCCPFSSSTCPAGGQYIMNPQTSAGANEFSPCTVGNVCSALQRNSVNGQCLSENRGVTTISGQQCGNGIVEPGEQCDCGGESGCLNDPCCNPTTCQFTEGSVCDDSNDDCCNQCQFASSGTVCRASTGQCDPEETCSGNSATCPSDDTLEDGTDCGDGLECASGQCTSRDQQCRTLMGSYTQNNDTYACNNSGCLVSCASPEFGRNVCYNLQQNFIPGTPCGGGGRCATAGQCRGGNEARAWIDDNRPLVIGLAAGIGGLLLIVILSCLISCCRRKRSKAPAGRASAPPPPQQNGWQGWNSQPQMQGGYYAPSNNQHPSQGWANQSHNSGGWVPPPVPPPAYTRTQTNSSVRYA